MHIMDGSNCWEPVDWRLPKRDEWYLCWDAASQKWLPIHAMADHVDRPQVILKHCSGLGAITLSQEDQDQLSQIIRADAKQQPVWDGNLISKDSTRRLAEKKLVVRCQGYTMPTLDGKEVLKYHERNQRHGINEAHVVDWRQEEYLRVQPGTTWEGYVVGVRTCVRAHVTLVQFMSFADQEPTVVYNLEVPGQPLEVNRGCLSWLTNQTCRLRAFLGTFPVNVPVPVPTIDSLWEARDRAREGCMFVRVRSLSPDGQNVSLERYHLHGAGCEGVLSAGSLLERYSEVSKDRMILARDRNGRQRWWIRSGQIRNVQVGEHMLYGNSDPRLVTTDLNSTPYTLSVGPTRVSTAREYPVLVPLWYKDRLPTPVEDAEVGVNLSTLHPSCRCSISPVENHYPYEGQVLRHKKSGRIDVGHRLPVEHATGQPVCFVVGTLTYGKPADVWADYEPFVVSDPEDE
jgi:hypothetical protein